MFSLPFKRHFIGLNMSKEARDAFFLRIQESKREALNYMYRKTNTLFNKREIRQTRKRMLQRTATYKARK